MPYYQTDQSDEDFEKIRWGNFCSECGRQLYIYRNMKTRQKYIACSDQHEGIAREYKPQSTDYQSNIRGATELEKEHGRETSRALATIPKQGQLTQPQAERILSLVYPRCPGDEIVRCAILCRDFGLHPLMKEVYLIPFKEKDGHENYVTVLGINATRKLMAQRGTYSYTDDTPRLMTSKEQIRIFGEVDASNIVAITKLRTKDGLEAPGYGRWPKDKSPYGMDKGNTKANMAFIRSERNAFGRLSPDALPPDIEVIDEAYAEVPDVGKVDTETGEIIEGVATEIEDTTSPEPASPEPTHWCNEHNCAFELKTGRFGDFYAHKNTEGGWCNEKKKKDEAPLPGPEPPDYEPKELRNLGDFFSACNKRWGLTRSEVEAKIGKSGMGIVNIKAEWENIKNIVETGE